MDYISVTINAVFTGLGVAFGNEIHAYFKERRAKIKEVYNRQFGK
jgi:hypothetical protein